MSFGFPRTPRPFATHVRATVKWYNPTKGFGFVTPDDGSADATAEIASRYPVRLIRQPNQGLSAARNAGMQAATGAIDRAESALRGSEPQVAWAWAHVAYQISRRSFLMGEEGPWVTLKRAELRDVLVRANECLSEPSIWSAEPEYAARHATEAVNLEPFRETSYQLLMRAHAAVGNRAEALRVYERCRCLLSEELGVSPSSQTEAVYLDILRS